MKRTAALFCCLLLALSIIAGCSAKEEPTPQPGAAGQPEEIADTTRMDTAPAETVPIDTTAADSM